MPEANRMARPALEPRRLCPTRLGGEHSLIAQSILPSTCLERQRANYHKCFSCEYRGLAAEVILTHPPRPPSEAELPEEPKKAPAKKPAKAS